MRRALPLLAHAFLVQGSAYIIRPTSAYRAIEVGLSPALVGLIAARFALLPLVVAFPAGRWTDGGREFPALLVGASAMALAGVGMLVYSPDLWSLLLWNAIVGLGNLLSIIGEQSLVARASREAVDSAFGTFTFAGSVGQAAAPLALAAVGGRAVMPNTQALMALYTVATFALVACTFLLRRLAGRAESGPRPRDGRRPAPVRVSPEARRTLAGAVLLSMLVLAAVDLIQVYLPALGVERGIGAGVIGVLLTLRAAATMLSRIGLSTLTGRLGRRRLVVVSSLVGGLAVALVVAPVHPAVLGAALLVAGFCLGVGQPLSMAIVSVGAPPGSTSTWLAVRLMGNRLGQSLVPAVVAVAAASTGTAGIFVATGIGLLITAGLGHVLIRDVT